MWEKLLEFIFTFLGNIGNLFDWLTTPLFTFENVGLGWLILERLGVDISFLYGITPLNMLGSSLVIVLTTLLILKFIKMILDAIPVA